MRARRRRKTKSTVLSKTMKVIPRDAKNKVRRVHTRISFRHGTTIILSMYYVHNVDNDHTRLDVDASLPS